MAPTAAKAIETAPQIKVTVTDRLDFNMVAYVPGQTIDVSPEEAASLKAQGVVELTDAIAPAAPAA